jgi:hypothetical protein
MKKIYKNPPPLAPEIEAAVREIEAGLREANGLALAGLKSTYRGKALEEMLRELRMKDPMKGE